MSRNATIRAETVSPRAAADAVWAGLSPFSPRDAGDAAPSVDEVATVPLAPPPATAPGASVSLVDVEKRFDDKIVLAGIDLEIAAGEFLVVIGKSGCGKSTLLRLLAGLDRPTGGTLAIGPKADGSAPNARTVFQEPRLLPWARVIDNVVVGLPAGLDKAAAREAALRALTEVHLHARADEWPSVLSGGQRQRVALARALVSRPDLLVLDEPLGALDALTRITMQNLIERVWSAQGFTAVLVTHDVAEAVALADRVVVIDDGRIALDLRIAMARPRDRSAPELAKLEGRLLDAIFGVAEVVY